jgi:hypothetical protein
MEYSPPFYPDRVDAAVTILPFNHYIKGFGRTVMIYRRDQAFPVE